LLVTLKGTGEVPGVEFRSIPPRRRVRIISGTAEDIRQQAANEPGKARQDFVLIRFPHAAARGDLNMPMLRELYPNALGLEIQTNQVSLSSSTMLPGELGATDAETTESATPVRSPGDWAREFLQKAAMIARPPEEAESLLGELVENIPLRGEDTP
jgi:hypothetical protein